MSSFNISDQVALEQYLKKQVSEFNRYRLNSSTIDLNLEPNHGHEVESDDVIEESSTEEPGYKTLFNDTETLVTPKPQTKTSTKPIKSKSSKRSKNSKDRESFINTFIKAIRFK